MTLFNNKTQNASSRSIQHNKCLGNGGRCRMYNNEIKIYIVRGFCLLYLPGCCHFPPLAS